MPRWSPTEPKDFRTSASLLLSSSRVHDDAILGPIFVAKIEDWEPHFQKMFAFWCSVALMNGRHHGQPMARHLPLPIWKPFIGHSLHLCSPHFASLQKIDHP